MICAFVRYLRGLLQGPKEEEHEICTQRVRVEYSPVAKAMQASLRPLDTRAPDDSEVMLIGSVEWRLREAQKKGC